MISHSLVFKVEGPFAIQKCADRGLQSPLGMLTIELLDVSGYTVPIVHPEIGETLDTSLLTLINNDLHAVAFTEFFQAVIEEIFGRSWKEVGGRLPCLGSSTMRHARRIAGKKAERDDIDPSFSVDINRLPEQLLQLLTVKLLFLGNHKARNKQGLLVMTDD